MLPGHTPLISQLLPGGVKADLFVGTRLDFYISGGVVEVQPHEVSVLVDTAIRAEDLMLAQQTSIVMHEPNLVTLLGWFGSSQALAEIAITPPTK